MRKRKAVTGLILGLALGGGAVLGGAPSASAGTNVGALADRPIPAVVQGNQPIWGESVNPFAGFVGRTDPSGERIAANCKRWAADQSWWYFVFFPDRGDQGYIPGVATNLTHSHLARCT